MNTKLTVDLTLELLIFLSKFEPDDGPLSSIENQASCLRDRLRTELTSSEIIYVEKSSNIPRNAGGNI